MSIDKNVNARVLVTGGLGYIGSHTVAEILRTTNWNVTVVDNLVNSSLIVKDNIEKATGKSIELLLGDLALPDCELYSLNPNSYDAVIHFAALKSVPESTAKPTLYYENNLLSTTRLVEWMKDSSIQKLIFSSSCAVYGENATSPVNENEPFGIPLSPYAHTKQLCEHIVQLSGKMSKIVLRYFNPAGADSSGLLGDNLNSPSPGLTTILCNSAVLSKIVSVFGSNYNTPDGSCIRDYIHVSDIASAHVAAVSSANIPKSKLYGYPVVNLGTGVGLSVLQVIDTFEKCNNITFEKNMEARRAGDIASIYASATLAEQYLDWSPKLSIKDIVISAYKWTVKNQIHEF